MNALNPAHSPDSPNRNDGNDSARQDSLVRRTGRALLPVSLPVAAMWVIHLVNLLTGAALNEFGLNPRQLDGLIGIVTMPLLHLNFAHLIGNSLAWLVLGSAVALVTRRYLAVTAGIWLLAGSIAWVIGREAEHIGASGVIYGYAAFLVLYGVLARKILAIIVSVLVVLNYAYLVIGLFPQQGISWEGHLAGAAAGVIIALALTRSARAARKARARRASFTPS